MYEAVVQMYEAVVFSIKFYDILLRYPKINSNATHKITVSNITENDPRKEHCNRPATGSSIECLRRSNINRTINRNDATRLGKNRKNVNE